MATLIIMFDVRSEQNVVDTVCVSILSYSYYALCGQQDNHLKYEVSQYFSTLLI